MSMAGPRSGDVPSLELFSAAGLVAVVTGGGTGIGLMMATALEKNGATVYIVGRRKEVLEQAAKENAYYHCKTHGRIIPLQGDVTSRESLLSVVSTIESQTGYINLLVNNSGLYGPVVSYPTSTDNIVDLQKRLWESPPELFQKTFEVNDTAIYFTTVAFLDLLAKGNKHGGIPGVSSQGRPTPGIAYTLSKAAAIHLGKVLSNVLIDYNIRTNIVCPGIYPSEMTAPYNFPEVLPRDFVPMRRAGSIDDMAGLILYLATRAGAYLNGNVTICDGGTVGVHPATY
ncbi:short chain dehydrogenase/reductase [Gautieria morchelliformis]|nr:short chain dehydrogenase/reductase [Gautieria morchelliformis]